MSIDDADRTDDRALAFAFASALIAGQFEDAHDLLDTRARAEWSVDALRARFTAMVSYFEIPPDHCEIVESLQDWPGKQGDDIAWMYVAICGASESEAVIVIVRDEDGERAIRQVEWGRP